MASINLSFVQRKTLFLKIDQGLLASWHLLPLLDLNFHLFLPFTLVLIPQQQGLILANFPPFSHEEQVPNDESLSWSEAIKSVLLRELIFLAEVNFLLLSAIGFSNGYQELPFI